MAAGGGSQCGYCTPGFVVSLFAEQYRPDRDGPCDTMALAGNLCRCTGYRPIRDARTLARARAGRRVSSSVSMQPAPRSRAVLDSTDFRDRRRSTRASPLLRDDPHAKLVAGATDLGVESNLFGAPMAASGQPRRDRRASGVLQHTESVIDWRGASAQRDWPRAGPTRPTRFASGSRSSRRR